MGFSKSSSKRDVYSNTILPTYKKQEKHQVDNLTLHLKQLEKEKQNKHTTTTTKKNKVSKRKEIIKIQAEINEKEMKETIVKMNKTKKLVL